MKIGSLIRADRFASVFVVSLKLLLVRIYAILSGMNGSKDQLLNPVDKLLLRGLVDLTWLMRHGYSAQLQSS